MSEFGRPRIAVMASGKASTLAAVVEAVERGKQLGEGSDLGYDVGLVISNNPEATLPTVTALNQQFGLHIISEIINSKSYPRRPDEKPERGITNLESAKICEALNNYGPFAAVACLGYMKIIRGELLDQFAWQAGMDPHEARMVNTHPGVLPQTADTYGVQASKRALDLGLEATAHSFHVVSADVDRGPLLDSTPVPVEENDTPETLFARVQKVEKAGLPGILARFLSTKRQHNLL